MKKPAAWPVFSWGNYRVKTLEKVGNEQSGERIFRGIADAFRLVVGNIFNAELAQNVLGVLHVIGEEFRFVGIASHREDTSAERPIESQDVTRGRRVLEAIVPARRVELDALAVLPEFLR